MDHYDIADDKGASRTSFALIAAVLALTLAATSPAAAEVCDKISGSGWRPGDWPTVTTTPSWSVVAFLGSCVAGLVLVRSHTAAIVLGAVLVAATHLHETQLGHVDEVLLAGVKEGCVRWQPGHINVLLAEGALTLGVVAWLCSELARRLRQR